MADEAARRLIVSMTSWPERIRFVPAVLEYLERQTRKPDETVLYLSEEQFPGKEADLPPAFRGLIQDKAVSVRFVPGDLKPHKKYIYAFREYPEDIIVTVDDDACYGPDLLEQLWKTHERFPKAVVAGRTHLITLTEEGKIRPYSQWIQRSMGFEDEPSLQLMAVGVGGVLYDPQLFPDKLYDEECIKETCLNADDLWLKAMELIAGIPVVRAGISDILFSLPDSQATALYKRNRNSNENDRYLGNIAEALKAEHGENALGKAILRGDYSTVLGMDRLIEYINSDKTRYINAVEFSGSSGTDSDRMIIAKLRSENERLLGLREHEREVNLEKNRLIEKMKEDFAREKHEIRQETNMLRYCLDHPILSRIDKTKQTLFGKKK